MHEWLSIFFFHYTTWYILVYVCYDVSVVDGDSVILFYRTEKNCVVEPKTLKNPMRATVEEYININDDYLLCD